MVLTVSEHIAYCFGADRPIFLDVARDRYFTVSQRLGEAFCAFIREDSVDGFEAELRALIAHGILETQGAGAGACACLRRSATPVRHEGGLSPRPGFRPDQAIAVASAVWAARRRLRGQPFIAVIERLKTRTNQAGEIDSARVLRLCAIFLRHRSFVPITSICLLDSIALLEFLDRHDAHADLVFGVTVSPFSAHCWLQLGDQVLNDHLDRVMAFTPILII